MADLWPILNIPIAPDDLRALSPAELQERALANIHLEQQAAFTSDYYSILQKLQNYRPPVRVPDGWSDWYAIGDQLH